MTLNFLVGGSMILFAFYPVTVRDESPQVLGFLLIPATALAALAASVAGPAATRFGGRTVLVGGLAVLLAGLLLLRLFDGHTSITVVVAAATQIMLDAIQTLSLVMAVVPIAAIMVAVLLIKPARTVSR